jgi:hypothetical protein
MNVYDILEYNSNSRIRILICNSNYFVKHICVQYDYD